MITSVWKCNLEQELSGFDMCLDRYPVITVDTEFPGFLLNAPRNSSEELRYNHLRINVNKLKIIQLGVTLSDDYGNIGGTWEFNFSDFDLDKDLCSESSIEFLKKNGLDLGKIRRDGVSMDIFASKFVDVLTLHPKLKWVTFHGLYDLAYLLKLLNKKEMPVSAEEFATIIGKVFGYVYDVKLIAWCCPGLVGKEWSLERLAKMMEIERVGGAHHAGSDSLLTAVLFAKMKMVFQLQEDTFRGFLYGISTRAVRMRPVPVRYCYSGFYCAPPVLVYGPSSSCLVRR